MERHSGKDGIVKHGTNVLDGVTNWTITESAGEADLTAAGDAWAFHERTHKRWSGEVTLKFDDAAAANQSLRAGDKFQFQFYTRGDATGRKFFEGEATVGEHTVTTPFDNAVERTYSVTGNGPLSVETVPV